MKHRSLRSCCVVMLWLCAWRSVGAKAQAIVASLQVGDVVDLNGRKAVVRQLDTLPYVESEFNKRFKFDSFENPRLKELRERHGLGKVIAPGETRHQAAVPRAEFVRFCFSD